jgi:hypothetical protein
MHSCRDEREREREREEWRGRGRSVSKSSYIGISSYWLLGRRASSVGGFGAILGPVAHEREVERQHVAAGGRLAHHEVNLPVRRARQPHLWGSVRGGRL